MSLLLDPAPDPHPAASVVWAIEQLLDTMQTAVEQPLPGAACTSLISELERISRRVAAVKLRLVAAAERSSVAVDSGFSGTDAWLARQTRTTRSSASQDVRLADDLDERCPVTRGALDRGDLSTAHAAVVVDAVRRLPETLSPLELERVEADLVAKAERFDPAQLRRVARRALESVEPDTRVVNAHEDALVHEEEATALGRARLILHDNDDETVSGHFTVPALAGAVLRKVIDAMTAPRRARGEAPPTDWATRRGAAFAELLEHLPTDHLHGKAAATVAVQLRYDVLVGALAAVGVADTGDRISAGEARRLACGAGIVPTVLGGESLPLDLGREQRLFTPAQRAALAGRHGACAADGCTRPFAWCELHHRKPWSLGGRTDLDQAVPLCGFYHRRIHDPGYRHRSGPDGIRFHRRP